MIVRAFWGAHIDLSKIVAISDAFFIDRMGSGGYFVSFRVDVQLLDKPLDITFGVEDPLIGVQVYNRERYTSQRRDRELISRQSKEALQKHIDELVNQWKESQL